MYILIYIKNVKGTMKNIIYLMIHKQLVHQCTHIKPQNKKK